MTATSRFDEAARTWDTPPRVEIARAVFGAIRDRGLVGPGTRALDFGAGTGLLTLAISDVAAEVTALDTSGEMLRVLGEKLAAGGVTDGGGGRCRRRDVETGTRTPTGVNPHGPKPCASTSSAISTLKRPRGRNGRNAARGFQGPCPIARHRARTSAKIGWAVLDSNQ